jgi:hypothetical protein
LGLRQRRGNRAESDECGGRTGRRDGKSHRMSGFDQLNVHPRDSNTVSRPERHAQYPRPRLEHAELRQGADGSDQPDRRAFPSPLLGLTL